MKFENILQPTADQFRNFRDNATGEKIFMLNLLKFRDKAQYEDGRETDLTGREAYALYGENTAKIVKGLGGQIIFGGAARNLLIGQVDQLWDQVALVEYPNMDAMANMMRMPEYQAGHVHREAGLAGQLLIECARGGSLK
ncbi:MAG: DUF1330 domain-containing protein [Acidimicrobiales bacterium]|nr:DUF1330 domain-containing protein [Hyphomonadaceae bacterium]RZV39532.1 MAG: DUF1330 domain-containing protein [Acidimicrobiales bacterium]